MFLGIFLMFCFMDQDTRTDPKPYNMPQPPLNLPPGVTAPPAGAPPAAAPAASPVVTPAEKH